MPHFPLEEIKRLRTINAELLEALKHLVCCADCKAPELSEAIKFSRQAITKAEA